MGMHEGVHMHACFTLRPKAQLHRYSMLLHVQGHMHSIKGISVAVQTAEKLGTL